MSESAEPRHERKFLIPLEGADPETAVKLAQGSFRTAFPSRTVNNIYFDTPDFKHFRDHVNGQLRRTKIRIRWYGESAPAVLHDARLELKHKDGEAGTKEIFELAPIERQHLANTDGISRWLIRSDLPPELRAAVLLCEPVLFNSYVRSYYVTTFGKIRVTFDRRLLFQSYSRWARSGIVMSRHSQARVLEVKYALSSAAEASNVMSSLPFRISRSSKYVLGISSIRGSIL